MSYIRGIQIATALLATAASTLRVYPHQLAYFNELAGGPDNGYRHLLGTNLELGQDLLALRETIAPATHVWFNLHGLELSYRPDAQHVDVDTVRQLIPLDENTALSAELSTSATPKGVLVLGVSALMQPELDLARARILKRAERVGYTIFPFHDLVLQN
ncbi:MAG: hypothetical protein AB7I48_15265 [Planctomycetaceae bacterium]